MKRFYSIGEISKIYKVSPDILRHYEKIGLIKPDFKKENGYRYYSTEQIWKLNNIRNLRSLGVGLERIKGFLETRTVESTKNILNSQLKIVEKELEKFLKLKDELQIKKENLEYFQSKVSFGTPILKIIPIRSVVKSKGEVKEDGEINFKLKLLSIKTLSENDFLFIDNDFGATLSRENFLSKKYEVYKETFIIDNENAAEGEIIKEGLYVTLFFKGSYSESYKYYELIKKFMSENNLEIIGDVFEFFHVDIHTTESIEEYITEIQVPVRSFTV